MPTKPTEEAPSYGGWPVIKFTEDSIFEVKNVTLYHDFSRNPEGELLRGDAQIFNTILDIDSHYKDALVKDVYEFFVQLINVVRNWDPDKYVEQLAAYDTLKNDIRIVDLDEEQYTLESFTNLLVTGTFVGPSHMEKMELVTAFTGPARIPFYVNISKLNLPFLPQPKDRERLNQEIYQYCVNAIGKETLAKYDTIEVTAMMWRSYSPTYNVMITGQTPDGNEYFPVHFIVDQKHAVDQVPTALTSLTKKSPAEKGDTEGV